jgi:hypothetical protein
VIEYELVETPAVYPAACFCGRPHGPAADTFVERFGERIYVCDKCVRRLALLFGYVPQDLAEAQDARIAELERRVATLAVALDDEQQNKVVSLADLPKALDLAGITLAEKPRVGKTAKR